VSILANDGTNVFSAGVDGTIKKARYIGENSFELEV
jgi:hypothetical protein